MQLKATRYILTIFALCLLVTSVSAERVMVPMADGTKLATDFHLPEGEGPWPVVVFRTVYGMAAIERFSGAYTSQGYAVVGQYARGRFDSEGTDRVFADDGWGKHRDGTDTLDWVRVQPWCNGKIGTAGASALGITQVMLAGADKEIAAQSIVVAASNFYDQVSYQGGVFRKNMIERWLTGQKSLHVVDVWKSHPYYDEFWSFHNAEALSLLNFDVRNEVLVARAFPVADGPLVAVLFNDTKLRPLELPAETTLKSELEEPGHVQRPARHAT